MGLFDFLSKSEEDDDDDVLAAEAAAPRPAAQPQPAPAPKPSPRGQTAPATPTVTKTTKAQDMPDFGIQKAIELMRDLPQQNVELVVQVVKKTLESMNVDVPTIIEDARSKQAKIQGRIKGLEDEIADYREEIAAREEEIAALKADFAETRQVRERLEMAQKGMTPQAAGTAPPTGRGPGVPPPGTQAPAPAAATAASGQFKKP